MLPEAFLLVVCNINYIQNEKYSLYLFSDIL